MERIDDLITSYCSNIIDLKLVQFLENNMDILQVKDRDGKIKVLPVDQEDLASWIEEEGSINIYDHAMYRKNTNLLKTLEKHGFRITLAENIIDTCVNSELGDFPFTRIQCVLAKIASDVIVSGDRNLVGKEFRDYRCWDSFSLGDAKQYWYCYDKWISSLDDMFAKYPSEHIVLLATLNDHPERESALHELLPNLKFSIENPIIGYPVLKSTLRIVAKDYFEAILKDNPY